MICTHVVYFHRGRRLLACECLCQSCHNGRDCICTDCSHDPEVHIEPGYYNRTQAEDRKKLGLPPAHVCRDCGAEVFRNGTKGRFPVRCPECKAKK